jgi:hypothetical protein
MPLGLVVKRKPRHAAALALVAGLILSMSACVVTAHGHGDRWIGQSAKDLVSQKGMPGQQMTAPSGAMVYVYGFHNLYGATLCRDQFYIREGKVVGFQEKGGALNCGQAVGETN